MAGIKRRSQGDPFRFIDKVSDLRQEFSFSARRIIVAAVYILIVVHWFACTLWWTIRLQNYPAGKAVFAFFADLCFFGVFGSFSAFFGPCSLVGGDHRENVYSLHGKQQVT